VSLALLASGRVQKAIITDIPDMLAHLQHNVHYNTAVLDPARAIVKPLRWGDLGDVEALKPYKPPFDLIVGSDLIYYRRVALLPWKSAAAVMSEHCSVHWRSTLSAAAAAATAVPFSSHR